MREDCAGLALTASQALVRRPGPALGPQLAPHFARAWLAAGGGPATSLDARLQRVALDALRQQLAELRGRNVEDGAVVVLHNASGEVRAWVGSSGSDGGDLDAVLARRQPGSTIKPFVYAQAIQQRLITADSWLADEPLQLASGRDAYQPQNHDHAWRGWVTARVALGSSLNVPAVRVGAMLGPDAIFEALQRSGLRLRESAGFHGHALALGSAEVTLLDLTNAYRVLANHGSAGPVAWPPASRTRPLRAFDRAAADAVAAILADPVARAPGFGFDNPLVTRRGAAAKTGTSKDMRDNWCIGFNDEFTVGVWIGNRSGAPMHGVSGVQGAAPVWRAVMQAVPGRLTIAAAVAPAPGMPDARIARGASSGRPWRIGPLQDGAVLAMDPDIPPALQRLALQGPPGTWSIDGKPAGHGARIEWAIRPGRHVVELRDGARLIDRVRFEVRPGIGPGPAGPGPGTQAGAERLKRRSMATSMTTPQQL